ncbi:amino acid ABC transporter substrate-binding protein [Mesorhizobium sp. B1-1-8]|uniref:amino acid ABC transporter substrate-binding protein n=1 Tax=Mesorhizobium sp. B1-1-8 TaxID=2589976 RepID=UPI00112EE6D8|nr:amino acid ABC transporter substrate-binding protein [Mesorhizobium sp. B1-1-8]UCI05136.1 amino acid ABC transporter substrate-binding protein [Mesorhizobium sp. B1-1-8]
MPTSTDPIRIGYSLPLSGPLGGNGRSARLAHRVWAEKVNRSGGLLGRSVELICEDDRTDATLVPGIYSHLLDVKKVDLVIGSYGTNSLLPVMPLIIRSNRFFVGLMGVGVNQGFNYPGYFAMIPLGPDSNGALTDGFFALAARQSAKPATVALLSADAQFALNPILGARSNAAKYGLHVIDERTYALGTEDFGPIIEAVAALKPDVLLLCSYLADSIGLVRAISQSRFKPKMVGGAMIGPQNADVKVQLGPLLNGFVNYEYWAPVPSMMNDDVRSMLDEYQGLARDATVDKLGHYMAPTAYSQLQVLEHCVRETGTLEDAALIAYARSASFETVLGTIRFGANGEWTSPRVLQVQFRGVAEDPLDQFRQGSGQVVVSPDDLSSGALLYPYSTTLPPRS